MVRHDSVSSYHQLSSATVDASEIRRSPVDMVSIPLFARFYTSKRWLFGISEPSTVLCCNICFFVGVFLIRFFFPENVYLC